MNRIVCFLIQNSYLRYIVFLCLFSRHSYSWSLYMAKIRSQSWRLLKHAWNLSESCDVVLPFSDCLQNHSVLLWYIFSGSIIQKNGYVSWFLDMIQSIRQINARDYWNYPVVWDSESMLTRGGYDKMQIQANFTFHMKNDGCNKKKYFDWI